MGNFHRDSLDAIISKIWQLYKLSGAESVESDDANILRQTLENELCHRLRARPTMGTIGMESVLVFIGPWNISI